MRQFTLAILLSTAMAPAQLMPGHAAVVVQGATAPLSRLLGVDLQTGAVTALPRFANDVLPPLALAFDPVDRELLLCVDGGGGTSRVLRFAMHGGIPGNEWVVGTIPGPVRQMAVTNDAILLAVTGAQGGLWRIPRTGGAASMTLALPHLSALQAASQGWGAVAWSGDPGPPASDAGVGILDFNTLQWGIGPETFPGFAHPGITGVMDLPTALPRQLLSHSDGTVSIHTMLMASVPVTRPVQPAVPPGGARAMKPMQAFAITPVVLGGAPFPHLWTFDPWSPTPMVALLSGVLPGDPVDFAIVSDSNRADLIQFGAPCGNPNLSVLVFTLPTLGNSNFTVQVSGGAPNAAALFAIGFRDTLGGALPLPLPGGCLLRTSADAVVFHVSNAQGAAGQPLPIPNQPTLSGVVLFAQWLQAPAGAFTASAAQAIQIGL